MMGKLRPMTALYLVDGDRILLLYRIGSQIADHSYIGCAGGHFEPSEYNDARACVLRELYEETGLSEDHLVDLSLRYMTMRLKNGEIRQNYCFFARLKDDRGLHSPEGNLRWVPHEEIPKLYMPVSAKHMILHYLQHGRFNDTLYGGITQSGGTVFVPMEEFEG
jgi:8-oxo-dGTP diphosphatase